MNGNRTPPRVLVVGGLNEDIHLTVSAPPADDGTALVTSWTIGDGGHAGNCAAGIAALGGRAGVLAAVGSDEAADRLIDGLRATGVDVSAIVRVAGVPSGRVVIPTFPDHRAMLMYRGANDALLAQPGMRVDLAGYDAVVILDPSRAAVVAVCAAAATSGVPVFWNPGGLHSQADWLLPTASAATALLMNRVEFADAFGRRPDPVGITAARVRARVSQLVVTLGEDGALACTADGLYRAPAMPVGVVDETGAGDAFTAAYVLGYLATGDMGIAIRSGCAAGALAVNRSGARAALPSLAELISSVERPTA
ncbi:MAG TPA: carbohydrate kinase family protein [Actinokineospora sp.]|jgi:ribokinase|nr:carbohydrate kinase family protein [Actinokineospora sp.]